MAKHSGKRRRRDSSPVPSSDDRASQQADNEPDAENNPPVPSQRRRSGRPKKRTRQRSPEPERVLQQALTRMQSSAQGFNKFAALIDSDSVAAASKESVRGMKGKAKAKAVIGIVCNICSSSHWHVITDFLNVLSSRSLVQHG